MNKEEIEAALEKLREKIAAALNDMESDIFISKRMLSDCLRSQPDLIYVFERLVAEGAYLEKEASSLTELNHSFAFTAAMKQPKRVMGTDARKFADCDAEYVESVVLYNKVYKTRKELEAIHDTLVARGYALKSLTDAKKAGIDSSLI